MPGNWYKHQHLNNGKVEWPAGPLTGIADQPTWLQAWVVQGGPNTPGVQVYPGASQSSSQSNWTGWSIPDVWIAAEPGWKNGDLQPAPAVGIALLALVDNSGNRKYEWWVDDIILE